MRSWQRSRRASLEVSQHGWVHLGRIRVLYRSGTFQLSAGTHSARAVIEHVMRPFL